MSDVALKYQKCKFVAIATKRHMELLENYLIF